MSVDRQPWKASSSDHTYRETVEFLEQLRPGGPWTLTAIIPDGPTETITATSVAAVKSFVKANDGKKNLYFSVNPTRTRLSKKAAKTDIAQIEYLLADLDPKHDESPEAAKERYLQSITTLKPASTAIIDSGNGLQVLWRLAEPVPLNDLVDKNFAPDDAKKVADIEARSALLMASLGGTAGTQNIDRILRLPGTTNLPNKKKLEAGRKPCPTKLLRFNNTIHTLEEFPVPPPQFEQPEQANGHAGRSVPDLFKQLPISLKKEIASPAYDGEDTSVTAASVITQLQSRGYLDVEIISLLKAFPKGVGKRYIEGKDLEADVKRLRTKFPPREQSKAKSSLVINASDIRPRSKDWLWEGHLLRGAQELFTGLPGLGKSQVQIHFVACVTAGLPWPNGAKPCQPMNVIMLTAEDTLEQEVKPRLMAAGANCERVKILQKIRSDGKDRQFLLNEDLEELDKIVLEIGDVGLITIDPITAYMGSKMDSHKATEVRSQLGPLKDFAERTNIAISTITHPPKSVASQKAIDHFIGSQAFIAAGRIGHICIPEHLPDQDNVLTKTGRVLFGVAKTNVYKMMPMLAYRVEVVFVENDHANNRPIEAPRVVWEGEVADLTADEAVAASASAEPVSKRNRELDRLQNMLIRLLKDGPQPAKVIEDEVAKAGYTPNQLWAAKKKIGVNSERVEAGWEWSLIGSGLFKN